MVIERKPVSAEIEGTEEKVFGVCLVHGLVEVNVKYEPVLGMNLPHKYCKDCGKKCDKKDE